MTQNLNQSTIPNNEINLVEVLNKLTKSPKLIILITLTITILSFIHEERKLPIHNSSIYLEIGSYEEVNSAPGTKKKLIEESSDLTRIFNIDVNIKKNIEIPLNVIFSNIENEIIQIKTSSTSMQLNKETLNIVSGYILNRHNSLFNEINQKHRNQLISKLNTLNDKIEFKVLSSEEEISSTVPHLNYKISAINKQIKALKNVIIEDQANYKLIQSSPELLLQGALKTPTINQVIYNYQSRLLELENEKKQYERELGDLSNKVESFDMFSLRQNQNELNNLLSQIDNKDPNPSKIIGEIINNSIGFNSSRVVLSFFVGLFLSIGVVLLKEFIKNFRNQLNA
jgi:hypothetical protein